MIPNFNNPGLRQQQQQHQQGQQLGAQPGQTQQEGHQGFDQRAWAQMHPIQQMRHVANELTGGSPTPQQQQQMMELLRQRQMQQHQQQQRQQMANGQQFMGGQGMSLGMGGPSGGPQQPSMGQNGPGQQHPQHMQAGFPNAPGMSNPPSMQSSLNQNAVLQAAFQASQSGHSNANNPQFNRQLERMLAQQQNQQQQPQNSSVMQARLEQQRQQQLGMNPAVGPQQGQQLQPGNPQQRRLTPQELGERYNGLKINLANCEKVFAALSQQQPRTAEMQLKLQQLAKEVALRKDGLLKMQHALQQTAGQMQLAQNGGQNQGNGSAQAPWGAMGNFENPGNGQPHRPMSRQATGPSPNVQPSPSHVHTPIQQPNKQPGVVPPPRSNPTPSQQTSHPTNNSSGGLANNAGGQPTGPFGNQMSPSMGQMFPYNMPTPSNPSASSPSAGSAVAVQQTPSGGQGTVGGAFPPPLERARFEGAYKTYSAKQGLKHEMRLMSVEGKTIDLYGLHVNVMQEGGWNKVHNNELWSVIGGRMGFVHFPGSESEPAKAGPGVAQRLAQVYKEYLAGFDQVYINSVIDSRRKMQVNQAISNGANPGNLPPNNPVQGAQSTPFKAGALPWNNPAQMAKLLQYANMPAAELRNLSLGEGLINFVEVNRANIQRAGQQGFIQNAMRAQHPEQGPGPQNQQLGSPFHGVAGLPPSGHPGQMQPGQQQPFPGQPPNGMPNLLGLPEGRQQVPLQQAMFNPSGVGAVTRPTAEQVQAATNFIQRYRDEFVRTNLHQMPPVDLPVDGRAEYQAMFQQLLAMIGQLEQRLPFIYFAVRNEDVMRKILAIMATAKHQQNLLTSGKQPVFVISNDLLRTMISQLHIAANQLQQYFRVHQAQQKQMGQPNPDMNRQQPPMVQQPPPPQQMSQPVIPPAQPPSIPPNAIPVNRPPVNLRPPPKKAGPAAASINQASSAATPPYAASTPVANASTPNHTAASPQQNQPTSSPKTRPTPKPRSAPTVAAGKQRRASVKGQAATPAPASSDTQSAPTPKETATSNAGTPNSGKRPREEEPVPGPSTSNAEASSSAVANEPSPPKRLKTEWEGPPSEELKKKQEAVENVKTEEDASVFLEQMTEFIKMTANGSGQEANLSSDISETLDMLLKGCGNMTDGLDLSSLNAMGESGYLSPSNKMAADDFGDFFDFSSFGTQDDESKAPTPELSVSSTNPSPESGSESEAGHHASAHNMETKTEEISDLLRLGAWKEIDGGESAYYQSSEWKWEGLMPTQDQPWAIS